MKRKPNAFIFLFNLTLCTFVCSFLIMIGLVAFMGIVTAPIGFACFTCCGKATSSIMAGYMNKTTAWKESNDIH